MLLTLEVFKEIYNKKYSYITNDKPLILAIKFIVVIDRPRDIFYALLHGKWNRGIILSELWNPFSDIIILNNNEVWI